MVQLDPIHDVAFAGLAEISLQIHDLVDQLNKLGVFLALFRLVEYLVYLLDLCTDLGADVVLDVLEIQVLRDRLPLLLIAVF